MFQSNLLSQSRMDERRNSYTVLMGTLDGKKPLWRHKRRWNDNINTHVK
jgi:hypothetical protein